jgi:hypothetical protein
MTVILVILADLCNGPYDLIITDAAADMIWRGRRCQHAAWIMGCASASPKHASPLINLENDHDRKRISKGSNLNRHSIDQQIPQI